MNIYPLVFSNNPRYRTARHVLFWLLWIIYFTFMYALNRMDSHLSFKTSVVSSVVEILIFTVIDMIHCYLIIYFLLPRYLFTGRYLMLIFLWIMFTFVAIGVTQFVFVYIIGPIRDSFHVRRSPLQRNLFIYFYTNFAFYNLQGCLAAAIKLGKMWFIKQQELNLIKIEKQKMEVEREDGRMQPVFLINALDRVESLSHHKPAAIPGIMKKIKNLMLYVIYDHNQAKVPLRKELNSLQEYVELEKISNDDHFHIKLKITGEVSDEQIAPFILLPLVENSFRQLAVLDIPQKCIDIDLHIQGGHLLTKITWSKPIDTSALEHGVNNFLFNIRKRLNLLYPESHDMKVIIMNEQFVVCLNMNLHRAIN